MPSWGNTDAAQAKPHFPEERQVRINATLTTANLTTTGANNIAIGNNAMVANSTGNFNTAIGDSAMAANTTANDNVAIGQSALDANTTGASNTIPALAAITSKALCLASHCPDCLCNHTASSGFG